MKLTALPTAGRGVAGACLALTLSALLFVLPVAAQTADQVGLYFDEAYTTHEIHTSTDSEIVTAYLVLKNPSASGGVAGWECRLGIEGPATLIDTEYSGQVINVLTPPQFMVGVSDPPLPGGDAVRLARFQLLVAEPQPVVLRLLPTSLPSLPDRMSYLDADGLTEVIPMQTDTGWDIAAWINVSSNPACVILDDSLSFGTIPTGTSNQQSLTVYNPGIAPLTIVPAIVGGDGAFGVQGAGTPITVAALGNVGLLLTFAPPAVGDFVGELQLSETCETVPLYGTGREPMIAWEMPTVVDFGEVPVGITSIQRITIRNTGEISFAAVPDLSFGCDDFHLQTTGTYIVNPGGQNVISVTFTPTSVDSFACRLAMGDVLPDITLLATSRLPNVSYESPEEIDFGDVDWGQSLSRTVVITNTGEIPLPLDFEMEPGCQYFTYSGPSHLILAPGQNSASTVTFTPQIMGEVTCQLNLGLYVPPIELRGTSTAEVVAWEIDPVPLVLPQTPIGVTRTADATIHNTGNVPFEVSPYIEPFGGVFFIDAGGETVQVEPGASRVVRVGFSPAEAILYWTGLSFGDGLEIIAVSGQGLPEDDVCQADPLPIDFGRVPQLMSRTRTLTVYNQGNDPLLLTPTTSTPELTVPEDPITVPALSQVAIPVELVAQTLGDFEGYIDLGEEACGVVPVFAEVVEPITPGADTVGLFYDMQYSVFESDGTPYTPITLYLALLECSSPSGVGGWECRIESQGGTAILLDVALNGPAINVGVRPDFIVGVATPLLPSQYGTLLATTLWFPIDTDPIFFTLDPTSVPSIPGQMAWLVGGTDTILPMYTPTGNSIVAIWNGSGLVGVDAPPPAAFAAGSQVTISWDRPDSEFEACRVLRRDGLREPEPVSGLIPNSGASLSFTDDLGGFEPGQSLYYSYGLYKEGQEVARSSEVEVIVPAAAQYVTGLLPNVPNPFNPQTEIRFQMEQMGHARILIYDVQGRKVRTLVDESLSSGPQSRFWYGKDDSGRQAPSGAYYVRMETDGKVDTRKILLLK